jgi:phosphopantetheinyl transferase
MMVNSIVYSILPEDAGLLAGIVSPTQHPLSMRRGMQSAALARVLLSRMLSDVWGIAPEKVQICSEPSGRPYLAPVLSRRPPFISISHTRGWVACAATEIGPLGIDIERQRRNRDHAGIAAMGFGPREVARAAAGGMAFYRIWTLREAIAKACGQGLALAADGLDRVPDGPDDGHWLATLDHGAWALSHSLVNEDTSLATAALLPGPCQSFSLERWTAAWP